MNIPTGTEEYHAVVQLSRQNRSEKTGNRMENRSVQKNRGYRQTEHRQTEHRQTEHRQTEHRQTEDIGRQRTSADRGHRQAEDIGRQRTSAGREEIQENPADFLYRFCLPENRMHSSGKIPDILFPGNEDEHMAFQVWSFCRQQAFRA